MQYDCNYDNLAPEGCTQYFFGVTTDLVKTYNFSGGHHLANQDQLICVRNVLILHQKTQKIYFLRILCLFYFVFTSNGKKRHFTICNDFISGKKILYSNLLV